MQVILKSLDVLEELHRFYLFFFLIIIIDDNYDNDDDDEVELFKLRKKFKGPQQDDDQEAKVQEVEKENKLVLKGKISFIYINCKMKIDFLIIKFFYYIQQIESCDKSKIKIII